MKKYIGSCVCNNISFKTTNLKDILYCHCNQCRTMTGNFMVASQVKLDDNEYLSICVGSLDNTHTLGVKGHVFTSEKAAHYDIKDGLPTYKTW